MPMERERYPDNWEEIALNVKREADWKCQRCGKQCRPGYLSIAQWLTTQTHQPDYEERDRHPQKWTLTVAHLDHDPENPDARLMAMCAPCHRKYDGKQAAQTRKRKRWQRLELMGQLTLPGV